MDAKEMSELLNGIAYPPKINNEAAIAKQNGLVIIHGSSDDLMEVLGAFDDEVGCYKGGTFYMNNQVGIVEKPDCECEWAEKYYEDQIDRSKQIKAVWGKEVEGKLIDWTYETSIQHETFDIMEDGEVYCRGMVFSMLRLLPL